jgi:pSer/pThr/pTyr-binding forkhead associated (FHA) protein
LAPHSLLEILKYFLLALLWLFFVYAIRMVWLEIRRSRPETTPAPDAPPVAADQRRGRVFELGQEVTLGRSPGCAIYLEDDTFTSSVHARVYRRNGELWLEDLRSTNGTFLNDSKVSEPMRIQRGDRIKVGSTILEVAR